MAEDVSVKSIDSKISLPVKTISTGNYKHDRSELNTSTNESIKSAFESNINDAYVHNAPIIEVPGPKE